MLAGGSGTRLRPLTHSGAKQLVPVANRPILHYVIDSLVKAEIRDIVVVISPQTGDEIRAALGDGSEFGARFELVVQERPLGLAHAVKTAEAALAGRDFCMYLGDNLLGSPIDGIVASFRSSPEVEALIMLKEVADPSAFGVAEVDDHGNVVSLVEKPSAPRSNLALVGVYLLRPSIFEVIDTLVPSPRGELEITDAISGLMQRGKRVRFERVDSWWLDTGKKDELIRANDTVLEAWLEAKNAGTVDASSRIEGRVSIGAGAIVESSTLVGPTIIGAGARILHSRVGPRTSLGDGVVVERSEVEHSVVLRESVIRDVHRLTDSVLGRRALVQGSEGTRAQLCLLVGDDCRVEVDSS